MAKAKSVNLAKTATASLANIQLQTEKKMASYSRMDYAGRGGKMYIGLKSEAFDGTEIILPLDANDGDKFFCVDSSEILIFYKSVWYKQS